MEKLITKIAKSQVFKPKDRLGKMVSRYRTDELSEESLELVCAAGKDDAGYAKFMSLVERREQQKK